MPLDQVAQMGVWQLDQWPALRMFVPTNQASFNKNVRGPIRRKVIERSELGEQELRVFSLVHSSRTVDDLVRLARLEAFEVCRSLGLLSQAKVIRRHRQPRREASFPAVSRVSHGMAHHAASAMLVCLVLGLGLYTWMSRVGDPSDAMSVGVSDPWQAALTQGQIARIRNALHTYRSRHGDYPARLDLLCEDGLLTQADLRYPFFDNPYTYRSYDDRFMLVRPKR